MTARVASIYFAPVVARRDLFQGGGVYKIPAVPLGGQPFILSVPDTRQIEQGPYTTSGDGNRRQIVRHTIDGADIANDIVSSWTQNGLYRTPFCHPGIWFVRERIALHDAKGANLIDAEGRATFRDATDEEKQEMWDEDLAHAKAADAAYAEALVRAANAVDKRQWDYAISDVTRAAAKQYGYQAEWLKEGSDRQAKTCPYCTQAIPARAILCPHCTQVVDVEEYARLEAEKAFAISDAKTKKKLQAA